MVFSGRFDLNFLSTLGYHCVEIIFWAVIPNLIGWHYPIGLIKSLTLLIRYLSIELIPHLGQLYLLTFQLMLVLCLLVLNPGERFNEFIPLSSYFKQFLLVFALDYFHLVSKIGLLTKKVVHFRLVTL